MGRRRVAPWASCRGRPASRRSTLSKQSRHAMPAGILGSTGGMRGSPYDAQRRERRDRDLPRNNGSRVLCSPRRSKLGGQRDLETRSLNQSKRCRLELGPTSALSATLTEARAKEGERSRALVLLGVDQGISRWLYDQLEYQMRNCRSSWLAVYAGPSLSISPRRLPRDDIRRRSSLPW